jgi:DNA invertase Pin-like site-specific DNA recombinase
MREEITGLRRALKAHRPGRGKRYGSKVKARVVEHARRRRAAGASWARIGEELGLKFETVRRWCGHGGMRRVEVVAEGGGLALVAPSGLRLEGLTVADAIAVLRALG